ncbi:MAG TPA: nuclear transport factor 2 family protein [Chthonomonadaceae bacterium]|nr:nuclear transport factor 2 family protein [Chthonomonadaceae bacterium]
MLRRKHLLFAALLFIGAGTATVRAEDAPEARKTIQAAYDRFAEALHRKDAAGATADLAPDFTELDRDGAAIQGTIPTERRQLQTLFLYSRSLTATETIQTFRLRGKRAIVTVKEQMVVDSTKQRRWGARPLTFCSDSLREDVWIRSGSRWRRQSAKTLSVQEMVDGRPDNPISSKISKRNTPSTTP